MSSMPIRISIGVIILALCFNDHYANFSVNLTPYTSWTKCYLMATKEKRIKLIAID